MSPMHISFSGGWGPWTGAGCRRQSRHGRPCTRTRHGSRDSSSTNNIRHRLSHGGLQARSTAANRRGQSTMGQSAMNGQCFKCVRLMSSVMLISSRICAPGGNPWLAGRRARAACSGCTRSIGRRSSGTQRPCQRPHARTLFLEAQSRHLRVMSQYGSKVSNPCYLCSGQSRSVHCHATVTASTQHTNLLIVT